MNELEKLDLEQQLETGIKPTRKGKKGKGLKNINLEDHQQMLEEKMRKEREEMRRELFAGIDFLDGGQLRISQGSSTKWTQVLLRKLYKCLDVITPHGDDVRYIHAKYDRAIEGFFSFFRFVVLFSIIMFVLFLGLIILHTIYYLNEDWLDL